jgi:formylglycine-generating enzyme
MKFVSIPTGEFLMGTSSEEIPALLRAFPGADDSSFADETPRHRVRITKPFLLAIHEVTVGHFRTFVNATGYVTDAERTGERRQRLESELAQFRQPPVLQLAESGIRSG